MRFFVTISMLCAIAANADSLEERTNATRDAVKNFNTYTCFIEKHKHKKSHDWETDYVERSNPYILLAKDVTGVLIGQPSAPTCEENRVTECKEYWVRTINYSDWWLIAQAIEQVKCPTFLQKTNFVKYVKKLYPEFNLK